MEILNKLDFGDAIKALKAGKKVARPQWKNRYLWIRSIEDIQSEPCDESILDDITEAGDSKLTICMYYHKEILIFNWLASSTDMLSEDWMIISK